MLSLCYRCDSIEKVQHKLDYLKSLLDDPVQFKNIYRFAFDFARVYFLLTFSTTTINYGHKTVYPVGLACLDTYIDN